MLFLNPSPITFPGLGIEIDPSLGFSIFGFEIRWYGVIIALGMLLAVLYASYRSKEFGLTGDDVLNVVIVGLPCAIVGARIYYVIFEWDRFFGPGIPWYKFLDIREGGLAIYGAVIGAAIGVVIHCKFIKKISIPAVLGANLLSLVKAISAGIDWAEVPMYLCGVAAAFVSGYLAIFALNRIAQRGKFGGFCYYCWGAGLLTLILSLIS